MNIPKYHFYKFISKLERVKPHNNNFFKAFTLAEVLITIGIIGVVAAVTIPNLITNHQKKVTVTRLKQTYSMIEQAVKLSENENGDLSSWNLAQAHDISFEQYLKNYLKIIQKRHSESLAGEKKYYKQLTGANETGLWFGRSPVEIYTLINGTDLILCKTSSKGTFENTTGISIYMDLNGVGTKPNQHGKDMFHLTVSSRENRRVYLAGTYSSATEYKFENEPNTDRDVLMGKKKVGGTDYNYYCAKDAKGHFCGRLIQIDGWEIRKDYPW